MNENVVVGIAGKMGAGKDSIAEILCGHFGFIRYSMADELKRECADALGRRVAPEGAPADICQVIERDGFSPSMMWIKPYGASIRRLAQWWGSEHRRTQDPDYWVSRMRYLLSATKSPVVIPDIRFENEAQLVRQLGGEVWLVRRLAADKSRDPAAHSHLSERFCDEYLNWDYSMRNDGTLDDLKHKIVALMRCRQELARIKVSLAGDGISASEREGCAMGAVDWAREAHAIADATGTP